MDTTQDNVSTRLARYLGYKQITKAAFETSAGIARGSLNGIGDAPHRGTIAKIRKTAPDLNIGWLLSGKGDMLLSDNATPDSTPGQIEVNTSQQSPDLDGAPDRITALIQYLKEQGLVHGQGHFADLIGYSRATLSQIKNSHARTPLALLLSVSETFPAISLDWLLYGTGDMIKETDISTHSSRQSEADSLQDIKCLLTDIKALLAQLVEQRPESPVPGKSRANRSGSNLDN